MAGMYYGYIPEFPRIRVDCFTPSPPASLRLPRPDGSGIHDVKALPARLYLLTHIHSDHLSGLSGDFTGTILCSPETKRMLPRIEAENERKFLVSKHREVRRPKYAGLMPRPGLNGAICDPIEALPYGVPKEYDLGYCDGEEVKVTITLLDANHCPGSAMFLIVSKNAAVLHTGDVRADDNFLVSLKQSPFLEQYLATPSSALPPTKPRRQLDRICVDTSALSEVDLAQKEDVLPNLVLLLENYPPETVFFFNIWTWGWEYIITAVAKHFGAKVHVDRYKYGMYRAAATDTVLLESITDDPTVSRFHACERFSRCDECKPKDGRLCVFVQMSEYNPVIWDIKNESAFRLPPGQVDPTAAPSSSQWFDTLNVPLARHSTMPELHRLVELFRPKYISPNTIPSRMNPHLIAQYTNMCFRPSVPYPSGTAKMDTPSVRTVVNEESKPGPRSPAAEPPAGSSHTLSLSSSSTTSYAATSYASSVAAMRERYFSTRLFSPDAKPTPLNTLPGSTNASSATSSLAACSAAPGSSAPGETVSSDTPDRGGSESYTATLYTLKGFDREHSIEQSLSQPSDGQATRSNMSVTPFDSHARSSQTNLSNPSGPSPEANNRPQKRARQSSTYSVDIHHLKTLLSQTPPNP